MNILNEQLSKSDLKAITKDGKISIKLIIGFNEIFEFLGNCNNYLNKHIQPQTKFSKIYWALIGIVPYNGTLGMLIIVDAYLGE